MDNFRFKTVRDVNPEELVGNINLALHHHMAPPGQSEKESQEESSSFTVIEDVVPEELVGNINLALHHHMAPPGAMDSDNKE